ncbi:protein translocase subunit SecF [Dokdonella fugitiva]|jgi:preprotein translocase subunit SecF|uniref:Protein-export membrane protein SecF n=1 Tax=Dokdonella fugitiva TaxID=328517 RepID=A0A4V2S216_9GAMM|nr:protein translocase subunit SecF [Dokdonella fugitiva]MBA8884033.1 preprotein translocase subunit SecF [Dokdonella fugitiva]TCO38730.1 preprotein translocase subunit SecF [Dokdonella fugitiva]
MELFNPNSKIDFLGGRKVSIVISALLVLASLGLLATRGLNYALDFTGGVLVEAKFEEPVQTDQVRAALEAGGFHNAQVQSVGGTREVSIRLQPTEEQKDAEVVGRDVIAAIKQQRADVSLKRHPDLVGSSVGAELRNDGIVAAVFVMLGIMIYIGIRFEKRFAIAAIASEIHDTILTLGFFSLTQLEFDLTVLAALLAVIGYSINDKVVVFDRVRELFRLARKAEPYEILNKAINQTLSRTIMTSLTTSLTMFALYFVGGPAVHGFGLTMLVGIVIGTLSSIFFANPILYWLGVSKTDLMPVTRENPELARRP